MPSATTTVRRVSDWRSDPDGWSRRNSTWARASAFGPGELHGADCKRPRSVIGAMGTNFLELHDAQGVRGSSPLRPTLVTRVLRVLWFRARELALNAGATLGAISRPRFGYRRRRLLLRSALVERSTVRRAVSVRGSASTSASNERTCTRGLRCRMPGR